MPKQAKWYQVLGNPFVTGLQPQMLLAGYKKLRTVKLVGGTRLDDSKTQEIVYDKAYVILTIVFLIFKPLNPEKWSQIEPILKQAFEAYLTLKEDNYQWRLYFVKGKTNDEINSMDIEQLS